MDMFCIGHLQPKLHGDGDGDGDRKRLLPETQRWIWVSPSTQTGTFWGGEQQLLEVSMHHKSLDQPPRAKLVGHQVSMVTFMSLSRWNKITTVDSC